MEPLITWPRGGEREGRRRGHFLPTAWKCFVNVTVRCRCFCCCPQAAWLVCESSVAGQKNLNCRHTCFNTGGKARGEEILLSAHSLHTVNHNSPNVPTTSGSVSTFLFKYSIHIPLLISSSLKGPVCICNIYIYNM